MKTLEQLYRGRAGPRSSPSADRSLAYGEIHFPAFLALIADSGGLQPGQVFLDLGSGTGKAVLAAALLQPRLRASVGVEIVTALCETASDVAAQVFATTESLVCAPVRVLCESFLTVAEDVLATADLVFIAATCFDDALFDALETRLASVAKPGSRLLVLSRTFQRPHFAQQWAREYRMAWGGNVRAFLYHTRTPY